MDCHLTVSKLKAKNNDNTFPCRFILILSGEISLKPEPVYNDHPPKLKEWYIFKIKGLVLPHLNVNSLLLKTDELRYIARLSNASVTGITESKLDNYIPDSEIQIDNYQIPRCDRNWKGRKGCLFCCFARNDFSYIKKDSFPEETENILFEILPPTTKPITIRIIYWTPNQKNFLQTVNENFAKLDTLNEEFYILGDFSVKIKQDAKVVLLSWRQYLMMSRTIF